MLTLRRLSEVAGECVPLDCGVVRRADIRPSMHNWCARYDTSVKLVSGVFCIFNFLVAASKGDCVSPALQSTVVTPCDVQ